jgi:hypothetical protein
MSALNTTAAILIMVACFTVLPFWLVFYRDVPVLWGLGGSFAFGVFVCVFLFQRGVK